MNSNLPLVSICIPVHNRVDYVVESVQSVINQDYKNIEIIILDNFSQDGSYELILDNFSKVVNLSIYRNDKNIGGVNSFNKLINIAKGDLIGIFHSDDIYHQSIVSESVRVFNKYPLIGMTSTYGYKIDKDGKVIGEYIKPKVIPDSNFIHYKELFKLFLSYDNVIMTPSAIVRKNVYDYVGLYRKGSGSTVDYDYWLRLSERYPIRIINKKLMYWREHKSQWSENSIRNYKHKPDSIRVYEEFSKNHNDLHSRYLKKYKFRILFYNSIKLNELGMFKDSNEFIYSEIIKSCSSSVIMNIKFLPLMIFNFFELRVSIKLLKNIKNYLSN